MTRYLDCCEDLAGSKVEVGSHIGSCCRLRQGEKWSDSGYVLNMVSRLFVGLDVRCERMVGVRADSRVRSLVMDEQCCCFLRWEDGGRINQRHPSRRSLWCMCMCVGG